MSSTLTSPLLRRTGSPGRSSGGLSDKPVEIDYLSNSDAYFSKLSTMKESAETLRKQDSDQEKTLMEYLPVNEKFNLNKEGKVIARWQERQREWERIQSQLQRKLTSKVKKPLMMATTDEYRARIEEYDLLQAAIPLKDRFSSSSWQVMLRGGGPVRVAIGHIFSGIECEVDLEIPKPKMVRKPKPAQTVGKNDTFLDQSATYLSKMKKYEQTIKEIRPHNLTYGEAGNLVMKSTNLFTWAKDSSAKYFQEKEFCESVATMSVHEQDHHHLPEASMRYGLKPIPELSESVADTAPTYLHDALGPKVDFLTSREVIFDAVGATVCTRYVTFRNCGSAAVAYRWRRVSVETAVRTTTDSTSLNGVLNVKGAENGTLRARTLSKNRDCFFCLREKGDVLPDETVSTAFTFTSCTGGGSFQCDWVLEFYPEETAVYQVGGLTASAAASPSGGGDGSGGANPAPPPMSVGTVLLHMKGHALSYDESTSKRAHLEAYLDRGAITNVARDVVFSCLRRVRDPVRLKDLQNRQIAHFRRTNATLLNALSARYTSMLPLFITPERLEMFVALYQQVLQQGTHIRETLADRRRQYAGLPQAVRDGLMLDVSAVDMFNPLVLTEGCVQCLREAVFPEETIEIFDEVTEAELTPSWNYDLSSVLDQLTVLLTQATEIGLLEEKISEYEVTAEKARLKVERLAARAASKESDDEDEDEEEDEPADEDDLPPTPAHPLVTRVQSLQAQVHATVFLLLAHPLPASEIYDLASGILGDLAEAIVDRHEAALVTCELRDMVVHSGVIIPSLPSPFTSAEGAAVWAHALAQTSHIAEPEAGAKKAPPKPAKNAPPPSEPTKQQIDFFYKLMYGGVRTTFLDASVGMFAQVDARLAATSQDPLKKYNVSLEKLFNVSALRASDCDAGGRIAFVSFHGSAFTDQTSVVSAFDVKQDNKLHAVAPVLRLAACDAKAIVLIYESPCILASSTADALGPYFEEIKTLITQQRAEYVAKTTRALRKIKQKPPAFKNLSFTKFGSFAEFYYHAESIVKNSPANNIPIILIENVHVTGVVPPEPVFVEEESDDDAAPVALGIEESGVKKRQDFDTRRPHRVQVTLDLTAPVAGAPKRTAAPPSAKVDCFADAAAAIAEAVQLLAPFSSSAPLWVDGTKGKLFDPVSVLPGLDRSTVTTRVAGDAIREAYLWAGVLQLLPQSVEYLTAASTVPAGGGAETDEMAIDTQHSTEPDARALTGQHLAQLFPFSAQVVKVPKAVVVLGGAIRADKFLVLDQLIDLVDTIFIVGEFALPFLCLSQRYQLTNYTLEFAKYHAVCSTLLAKARMRGCELRWPVDMLIGDLEVTPTDRLKCFNKVDPEARNEGSDYEGEVKVHRVSDAILDAGGVNPVILPGFAYDLGPESIAALKAALLSADLVISWGTVGVCESGAFQAGQQCLVEFGTTKIVPPPPAAPVKPPTKGGATAPAVPAAPVLTKNSLRTVLLGDSNIEWCTRLLDADGELGGDLVGAGVISYSSRDSSVFAGLMGLFPSRMVQAAVCMRPPHSEEFLYSTNKVDVDEDEEDEDEDEEEDD